ncbi:unnamed protein product [Brassica napus]|uniref:(rape) hypothetical protein n=1 Tax=Brassica napus TaxID=3708 RepID=A0A816UZ72_BRANA|nr:unnamed protein product [Brassica napus]
MAESLSCGETTDSWITDETNCDGGFMNDELFSKDDNFNGNGSNPMMGSLPSPSLREERIREMMEREVEFLPGADYLKRLRSGDWELRVRNQALDWILKVCAHYNFGTLCICLSMNYLDRFLTSYELPRDKSWAVQLLAVSCLSLAAKMEESDVPQTVELQQVGDPKFVFEAKTVKRMELLVLNTLNWRLQALTPFSFIDHFIHKTKGHVSENSIYRSSQFILNTTKAIEFLDFRPSEIAAAAAVSVTISGEVNCIDDEKTMSNLTCVKQQERVKVCLNLMRNLTGEDVTGATLSSRQPRLAARVVPVIPIGVLEATCLSCRSDERTVESCTNSSQSSPDTNNNNNNSNKRRRKQ